MYVDNVTSYSILLCYFKYEKIYINNMIPVIVNVSL